MKTEELEQILKAPFLDEKGKQACHWKPQGKPNQSGETTLVPYLKASQVRDRLNEAFGVMGWSDTKESNVSGTAVTCIIEAEFEGKKVMRSGVGTAHGVFDSVDKDKTMDSDSLKRAGAGFGIGAYMKDIPRKKLKMSGKQFLTADGNKLWTDDAVDKYLNTGEANKDAFIHFLKECLDDKKLEELKPEITKVWKAIS